MKKYTAPAFDGLSTLELEAAQVGNSGRANLKTEAFFYSLILGLVLLAFGFEGVNFWGVAFAVSVFLGEALVRRQKNKSLILAKVEGKQGTLMNIRMVAGPPVAFFAGLAVTLLCDIVNHPELNEVSQGVAGIVAAVTLIAFYQVWAYTNIYVARVSDNIFEAFRKAAKEEHPEVNEKLVYMTWLNHISENELDFV